MFIERGSPPIAAPLCGVAVPPAPPAPPPPPPAPDEALALPPPGAPPLAAALAVAAVPPVPTVRMGEM